MFDFDIPDDCVPLLLWEGEALIEGLWVGERDVRSDCETLGEREEDAERDEDSDVRELAELEGDILLDSDIRALAELDGDILLEAETDVDPV